MLGCGLSGFSNREMGSAAIGAFGASAFIFRVSDGETLIVAERIRGVAAVVVGMSPLAVFTAFNGLVFAPFDSEKLT